MLRRHRTTLACTATFAALLAGCSSGSGADTADSGTTVGAPAVTEAATTAAPTTAAPTSTEATTTAAPTTTEAPFTLESLPGKVAIAGPGCGDEEPALSPEDLASLGTIQSVEEAMQLIGGGGSTTIQICVMNPDGSDLRLVSKPNADADSPGWSYDGKTLLFGTDRKWVIVNADGSGYHLRKKFEIPTPYQSPDGKWYLYREQGETGVRIAPIDQPTGRRLVTTSAYCCGNAAWSPDSRFVLYTAYDDAARKCLQLWRIDIGTGETFKITGTGTPSEGRKVCVYPDSARWSPDGSSIMFVEDGTISGRYRLHLVSPDGSNPRDLLPDDAFSATQWDSAVFAWSPDGKAVMFEVVTDDGGGGLFVSPPDGSVLLEVKNAPSLLVASEIAWAPGL